MSRAIFILLVFTVSWVAAVTGATGGSSKAPVDDPMKIAIVRDNMRNCEPHCAEWIMAQGDIVPESAALLRRVLKLAGSRKLPLFIHSKGGRIEASLAMGRLIRARHLDVTVSKTILDPCQVKNKACSDKALTGRTGAPQSYDAECASSCAFILAAGEQRHVPHYTYVGVHQFTNYVTTTRYLRTYLRRRALVNGRIVVTSQKLVKQKIVSQSTRKADTPKSTYDRAARYFSEMGVADNINTILQATPASGIHWLSLEELRSTNLMTDRVDSTIQVAAISAALASATPAPTPPAPAAATAAKSAPVVPAPAMPLPTQMRRSDSDISADSYIPLGRYHNADVMVDVTIRYRVMGPPVVTVDFTPRNAAGPVPTSGLVASAQIGSQPWHQSETSASSAPFQPLTLDIPLSEFCTLRETDSLALDLKASSGGEFEEGKAAIQTESRFMTAHALLQHTCPQTQATK